MDWKFPDIQPGRWVLFLDTPTSDLDSALPMLVLTVGDEVLEGLVFSRTARAMFTIRVTHIHDPRTRDSQYVNSIVAEENAGFFVEQTRDILIEQRLSAIEDALSSMSGNKNAMTKPLAEAVAKIRELKDEGDGPGKEIPAGKVKPLDKRLKANKPLTAEQKAEKDAVLAELGVGV